MSLYAVILAGGSGTRFWPLSRKSFPKQFLAIGGTEPMLARTVRRVEKLVGPERTLIVTGRDLLGPTADCVPWLTADNLLAEPAGRNTAPCVGLAARLVSHRDRDAVMAVLPADHVIADEPAFRGILEHAARLAAFYGAVVTLAIPPRYAETGYGYMELGERIDDDSGLSIRRVDRFHEKPDRETAEKFVASGKFAWNSGVFVFRAHNILAEIERLLPDLAAGLSRIDPAAKPDDLAKALDEIYPTLPAISIDHGVMEKAHKIVAIEAEIGWSDVGSYLSLPEVHPPDEHGNAASGDARAIDSTGNILAARQGKIVTLGVSDLIVVHTPDVTFVCPKERAQEIRDVVHALEKDEADNST